VRPPSVPSNEHHRGACRTHHHLHRPDHPDQPLGLHPAAHVELEFGSRVDFRFTDALPADWLRIDQTSVAVYLASDRFKDVYHLLQTENPAFCTVGNFFGLQIGSVHTELDLARGEPTGEGYDDRSLEAVVVRACAEGLTGLES
jgi:hypothetical protein